MESETGAPGPEQRMKNYRMWSDQATDSDGERTEGDGVSGECGDDDGGGGGGEGVKEE